MGRIKLRVVVLVLKGQSLPVATGRDVPPGTWTLILGPCVHKLHAKLNECLPQKNSLSGSTEALLALFFNTIKAESCLIVNVLYLKANVSQGGMQSAEACNV